MITSVLLALSIIAQSAFAAEATQPVAIPEISAITVARQGVVASQEVAGAVTLVASPDKIVHLSAVGFADLAANRPMKKDSIEVYSVSRRVSPRRCHLARSDMWARMARMAGLIPVKKLSMC